MIESSRAVSAYYIYNQSFFDGKQVLTGNTNIQDFTAQRKSSKNGQLKQYSTNPDPM